jgi:hypothetical protein
MQITARAPLTTIFFNSVYFLKCYDISTLKLLKQLVDNYDLRFFS